MKYILTILATIASLTAATAIPDPTSSDTELSSITRRKPKDESGNSQIILSCEGETIPQPGGYKGGGEGGGGYFGKDLVFYTKDKKKKSPDACTDENSTCSNCIFSGGDLSSPTNVTACWNPPAGEAGCSIKFKYGAHEYDSQNKQDKCGHVNKFKPFEFGLSALCYFDV